MSATAETAPGFPVPEVGDIVRGRGREWTVVGWGRVESDPDTGSDAESDAGSGGERATETEPVVEPVVEPRRLLFATRATATHVRLRQHGDAATDVYVGLAGIEPTGERVLFAPSTIRVAHLHALKLDGQPTDRFTTESEEPS